MRLIKAWTAIIMLSATLVVFLNAAYLKKYDKKICNPYCPETPEFVCGSDGTTYVNECALEKAICEDQSGSLRKHNNGPCEEALSTLCKGLSFDPVCVSDHMTYSNVAFMHLRASLTTSYRRVLHEGICVCGKACVKNLPKNDLGCPAVYNPVCGDNGITYSNECVFEKQKCIMGGKGLNKLHNGVCKDSYEKIVGMERFDPVCGSDGNTYSSKSFVSLAQSENYHLSVIEYKPCRPLVSSFSGDILNDYVTTHYLH